MTEPERWTDARYAEEQVALARRQAEVARAEARELRVALVEAENRVGPLVAERDKLRADLDHLHVGTIDHERMAALEAELRASRTEYAAQFRELVQVRAALEAARAAVLADRRKRAEGGYAAAPDWAALNGGAAVHTPSPGGSDAWVPPILTPEQVRAHLAEGLAARAEVDRRLAKMERPPEHPDQRLVDGIVDAASAARRGAPRVVAEGRDPATRSRALPVVPAACGECKHVGPLRWAPYRCAHPDGNRITVVLAGFPPPHECPIRAELAKAGGA